MVGKPLVTVAGVPLPEPSTYNANVGTFVDSARNAEGVVIGSVIRDDVAKVDLTWRFLTAQQWADINRLFKISAGGQFFNTVDFLDQTTGTWVTKQMYVSDRNAGMTNRGGNGEIVGWLGSRIALIEV